MSLDWSLYPNFSEAELRCKHSGLCEMHPDFMKRLQSLRGAFNRPMVITSGYRHPTHPVEAAKKGMVGAHTFGRAVDVAIQGPDALRLVQLALAYGFTGIGVAQKGPSRFIHLDDVTTGLPRPNIWSY